MGVCLPQLSDFFFVRIGGVLEFTQTSEKRRKKLQISRALELKSGEVHWKSPPQVLSLDHAGKSKLEKRSVNTNAPPTRLCPNAALAQMKASGLAFIFRSSCLMYVQSAGLAIFQLCGGTVLLTPSTADQKPLMINTAEFLLFSYFLLQFADRSSLALAASDPQQSHSCDSTASCCSWLWLLLQAESRPHFSVEFDFLTFVKRRWRLGGNQRSSLQRVMF